MRSILTKCLGSTSGLARRCPETRSLPSSASSRTSDNRTPGSSTCTMICSGVSNTSAAGDQSAVSTPSSGNSVRWIVSSNSRFIFSWMATRSWSEFHWKELMEIVEGRRSKVESRESKALQEPTFDLRPLTFDQPLLQGLLNIVAQRGRRSVSFLFGVHVLRVDDFILFALAARLRSARPRRGAGGGGLRGGPVYRLGEFVGGLMETLRRRVHVVGTAGLERLPGVGQRGLELGDLARLELGLALGEGLLRGVDQAVET